MKKKDRVKESDMFSDDFSFSKHAVSNKKKSKKDKQKNKNTRRYLDYDDDFYEE